MTQHNNLSGQAFITASIAGFDRAKRLYGDPSVHLEDKQKAANFILQHIGGTSMLTTRDLLAIQLVQGALGVLRAEAGQELSVLANISTELALHATQFAVPQEEAPKTEHPVEKYAKVTAPTPHSPEMNKALEPRTLPPQTSRPALIAETPKV